MAVGLALCGRAGKGREHATGQLKSTGSGYWGILVLAVISGVLAALLNIAMAFGDNIMAAAREGGAAQAGRLLRCGLKLWLGGS
jgi:hypothetical protein